MSGDVQPRKRKDKKKKRDVGGIADRKSETEFTFSRHGSMQDDESSHGVHITKMGADDMHLHVQHDHGTGGHWCAKIIFFFLMALLVGLVGIIIMENRDSTDMDTPLSESRFSTYFQGWVDEHRQEEHEHDHEDLGHQDDHDENDDQNEEDVVEHDHDNDEDDNDEVDIEEEEEHDEDVSQDERQDEDQDGQDNDDEEYDDDNENNMENVIINDNNDDADIDDDRNAEEFAQFNRKVNYVDNDDDDEEDDDDEDEDNNNIDNNDNGDDDMDDNYHNEHENNDEDDEDFDDDNDDDDNFDQIIDNDAGEIELLKERARQQAATEEANKNKYRQQGNSYDENTNTNDNDDDADADDDDEANNAPSWANALLTKIGIGIALAFVARLVLVKKNTKNSSEFIKKDKKLMEHHLSVVKEEPQQLQNVSAVTGTASTISKTTVPVMHSMPMEMDYSEEEIEIVEEIEYIGGEEDEEGEEKDKEKLFDAENVEVVETIKNQPDDNDIYKSKISDETSAKYRVKNVDNLEEMKEYNENILKSTETVQEVFSCDISVGKDDRGKLHQEYSEEELIVEVKSNLKNDEEILNERDKDMIEYDEDDIYEDEDDDDNDNDDDNDDCDNAEMDDIDSDVLNDDISLDDDDSADVDDEEEDDVDCEGGIDDDEDDDADDDISDIDDTELMNRLEAKYGKLPVQSNSTSEDDNDDEINSNNPQQKNQGPKTIFTDDNDYNTFGNELRRVNEEIMREFSYY